MIVFKKKSIFSILTVVILVIALSLLLQFNNNHSKLDYYLSLGDSFAYGIQENNSSGDSYSDMLASKLIEDNLIENYTKTFTKANMTSQDLLKIIDKNAIGVVNGQSSSIHSLIRRSKYITLQVGLYDFYKEFKYDPQRKNLDYDKNAIMIKLSIMQQNLYDIIEQIKDLSPESEIFVLGYYFLFPWLDETQRQLHRPIFNEIRSTFTDVSNDTMVNFVSLDELSSQDYITSAISIFPTASGYQLISSKIYQMIIDHQS